MTLNEIYYKVEISLVYETYVYIEKYLYNGYQSAEERFEDCCAIAEYAFMQNKVSKYTVALAEVHKNKKLQKIFKCRRAPL